MNATDYDPLYILDNLEVTQVSGVSTTRGKVWIYISYHFSTNSQLICCGYEFQQHE